MELVVRTRLDVTRDQPLTTDRVFRRLEVARQRLSLRWCGRPGGFAGYDVLNVEPAMPSSGVVVFEARLLEKGVRSHVVELTAVEEQSGSVLLKGHGRTLECSTASERAGAPPMHPGRVALHSGAPASSTAFDSVVRQHAPLGPAGA